MSEPSRPLSLWRRLRRLGRPALRLRPVREAYTRWLARASERSLQAEGATTRVTDHWGQVAQQRAATQCGDVPEHWLDSRLVSDLLIWPRLGGHHWYGFLKEHYFPQPVERVLSVGCGSGHLERGLQSHGICVATEAFDVSPAAVVVAQEKAAEAGCGDVRYWVADGNSIRLPRSRYDAVFASMSLHHVTKLERLLKQIHGALKPGGIFVVNEYVGPSRFQWTDAQLRIMNEALPLLPDRLRLQSNTGAIKTGVCRPSVEDVIREDPSEAVRSADIPRLLRRYFRIETRVDYGGTLLYPLLEYIVGNFDASREDDVAILRLLSHLEDELIRDGILQSDFAFFVARRR